MARFMRLALALACCAAMAAAVSAYDFDSPAMRKMLQSGGAVHPRLGIHDIDAMDDDDPYKLVMCAAWSELTASEDRASVYSYWRLAGVHGKKWTYNDSPPPSEGYCKHRQPSFGPWHRAYMRMFETALMTAATNAAKAIEDTSVRATALAAAKTIRLPYWDWTNPAIPGILSARTVSCYQADGSIGKCPNPFAGYEYIATAGSGRSAGGHVRRAGNWQGAMRGSASTFARQMASFVRSNNWRCTYTGAGNCFGNLEQVHNDIHNIMGGSGGDMATIEFAGFDPTFWLHHCMLDRALWLFQNNGGGWQGARSYSPFQNVAGNLESISSLGYSYGGSGGGGSAPRRRRDDDDEDDHPPRRSSNPGNSRRRRASLEEYDAGAIGSSAGKAAVKEALEAWSGNYTGFQWAVRFQELNEHQLDKVAHLYVFLDTPGATAGLAALPSKVAEYNDLRIRPNFCGSASGFNDYNMHAMHASGASVVQNRAVDLTECLQKAGIRTDVSPANAADPTRGPSKAPIKLSDLKIMAVNSDGEDVSHIFDFGKPVISWSLPVSRTVGAARAAIAEAEPADAVALMSAAPALVPEGFAAADEVASIVEGNMP